MKVITETTYPAKVTPKGHVYYVSVPLEVIKRMGLEAGDYVDVTLKLPSVGEYEPKRDEKEE